MALIPNVDPRDCFPFAPGLADRAMRLRLVKSVRKGA